MDKKFEFDYDSKEQKGYEATGKVEVKEVTPAAQPFIMYFKQDKDGKVTFTPTPPKSEYIWLEHHPLNCICGSKNLKQSNLVYTTNPLIYVWWCDDCEQHYKVQARGMNAEAEYKELKVNE